MAPLFWTLGCIYGASSVVLGAFGAHVLKKKIPDPQRLANWSMAAHYQVCMTKPQTVVAFLTLIHQLIHSGVLLISSTMAPRNKIAAGLFTAGMTMFSGSVYLLVLDPQRFKCLGLVTPLGGTSLIAGWIALAFTRRPILRV